MLETNTFIEDRDPGDEDPTEQLWMEVERCVHDVAYFTARYGKNPHEINLRGLRYLWNRKRHPNPDLITVIDVRSEVRTTLDNLPDFLKQYPLTPNECYRALPTRPTLPRPSQETPR